MAITALLHSRAAVVAFLLLPPAVVTIHVPSDQAPSALSRGLVVFSLLEQGVQKVCVSGVGRSFGQARIDASQAWLSQRVKPVNIDVSGHIGILPTSNSTQRTRYKYPRCHRKLMVAKILQCPHTQIAALRTGVRIGRYKDGNSVIISWFPGNSVHSLVNEIPGYTVEAANNNWSPVVGPGRKGSSSLAASYVGYQPYVAGPQEWGCDFAARPALGPAPVSHKTGGLPLDMLAERSGKDPERMFSMGAGCAGSPGIGGGREVTVTIPHHQGSKP